VTACNIPAGEVRLRSDGLNQYIVSQTNEMILFDTKLATP